MLEVELICIAFYVGVKFVEVDSFCHCFPSLTGCGSLGWQSPKQLLHGHQTRAMDIFNLGLVLFFCITCGRHLFGKCRERDINIENNKKDLSLVEFIPEAHDLISHLLSGIIN